MEQSEVDSVSGHAQASPLRHTFSKLRQLLPLPYKFAPCILALDPLTLSPLYEVSVFPER